MATGARILPESQSSSSGEDGGAESSLLRNVPSSIMTSDGGKTSQKRRRRVASLSAWHSSPSPRQSFRQEVGHAAAETYLVTGLTWKLLRYLGVGYRWITKFLALACYAVLLMPGFLQGRPPSIEDPPPRQLIPGRSPFHGVVQAQHTNYRVLKNSVGYYYFFSPQIRRSIVYGDQPRNRLDLYLPKNTENPKPVVAFITGGAWIIGYKAWGSFLGKQLAERDIIVACIDYRNFPQGTIGDMVQDASQGISFVCNNIANYGGDPDQVYVIGQSAGAHIAACALLEKARRECGEEEDSDWSVSQIKAYMGISGGYNMMTLIDYFHGRGLYRSIFLSIMEGEQSLRRFSPELAVQQPSLRSSVHLLPRIILFHGTGDYSIPSSASEMFAEALRQVGAPSELILYKGKTHTDLFIQDPMRGGKDELLVDILRIIHAGDPVELAKDANAPPSRRLVPEFMIQLARQVSPF